MTRLAGGALHLEGRAESAPRWFPLQPLLLACVLAVWFGYGLDARALWSPDEGRYAEIPREMVVSGDYLTPRLNGVKYFEKPPLVYWLTAGSIKLFGIDEWTVRIWPAVFALIGCMTVYYLGRRLYGARAGVCAAIILALSPLYDLMGGALVLDMPLTGFLTLAMASFLLGVREPPGRQRRLWLYGFYASIALAVLTKGLVGIAIPGLVIGAWIVLLGEWRLPREIHLVSGSLVFLVIAVPWHVLVSQANPEFAHFYFIHEHLERYLTTAHHRYKPFWYFVPVLLASMYPWIVLLPQALSGSFHRLWRERQLRSDIWFLLLWAALPFIFFSFSNSKLIPYILPVLPPLALLIGRFVAVVWERSKPLPYLLLWMLFTVGVGCSALFASLPIIASDSLEATNATGDVETAMYAIATAMFVAGVLPLLVRSFGGSRATLVTLIASGALIVLVFEFTLPRLDSDRSIKELTLVIKDQLRTGDEVISYRKYFQDLPVYLQRRITIVEWKGELAFGATAEDTSGWMIDEAVFRERWAQSRTIYLMTTTAHYAALLASPPGPMCLLGSTKDNVVAVNREC